MVSGHRAVDSDGTGLLQASLVRYQHPPGRLVHAVLVHVMEGMASLPDQGPEPDEVVPGRQPSVPVQVRSAAGDHQIVDVAVVLDVGRYRPPLLRVRVYPCLVRQIQGLIAIRRRHLLRHAHTIAEAV